jgi:hypothetical protein
MHENHAAGARGEMLAAAWFLARGWLVFSNVAGHGIADLAIARKRGRGLEKYLVEVRWTDLARDGGPKPLSKEQQMLGVTICFVASDGTVSWSAKQGKELSNDADVD